MNKQEWKLSDRTTCPRCGSSNYKEANSLLDRFGNVFIGFFTAILILLIGLLFPILLPIGIFIAVGSIIAGIVWFFKPPKMRKCLDCKKHWQYFREPDQSS